MPADALMRLNEVTNELMELARASRANKVRSHMSTVWVATKRPNPQMCESGRLTMAKGAIATWGPTQPIDNV